MFDPIATFWIITWISLGTYGLGLLLTGNKAASTLYLYGKSLDTTKKNGLIWRLYFLPKRCFTHFYLIAVPVFLTSLVLVSLYYTPPILRFNIYGPLKSIVETARGYIEIRIVNNQTSASALIFTLILMVMQSARRLYESAFISVYSNKSKINILHYVFGHAFYIAAAISTVCPILLSDTSEKYTIISLVDNLITKQRAIAFVLFVYASLSQHNCHKILANLRKDKTGQVITEQHFVPSGGLFEYVSCPHFLLEVIIYFLILVIQEFENYYWNLIFQLVFTTQTLNAITEHKWYKRKYKDYPKERKAIFPKLL